MRSRRVEPAYFRAEKGKIALSARTLASLARAVLEKGRPFRFLARGFSMSPFIRDGDILTVSPVLRNGLTVGDVAAVAHPVTRKLIIHRVTGLAGDSVIVHGDNAASLDESIPRADILGRVTRIERNGRDVSFGLGPERVLIPRFNRLRRRAWLRPLLNVLRPVIKP